MEKFQNIILKIIASVCLSILSSYIFTVFVTAVLVSIGFDIENAGYIFLVILGCVSFLLTVRVICVINKS